MTELFVWCIFKDDNLVGIYESADLANIVVAALSKETYHFYRVEQVKVEHI